MLDERSNQSIQNFFQSNDFNKNYSNINRYIDKLNNNGEFQIVEYLNKILKTLIIYGCKLDIYSLDNRGNKFSGWSRGKKRGGFDYIPPPAGWKGFGINVAGKYDNGNDDWLGKNGNNNEWAVAYHGIGVKMGTKITLEEVTKCILNEGFKPGNGQAYADDDDERHPGRKVGKGVYCSPDPNVMELYANWAQTSTYINGNNYIMGFMIRVKPDKIRYYKYKSDYWVLNGDTSEMRPYRILIKEKNYKEYISNLKIDNSKVIIGEEIWCSYIKNSLINSQDCGHIYRNVLIQAAIVGINGNIYARTNGINFKDGEIQAFNELFKTGLISYRASILKISGKTYRVIHFEKDKLAYLNVIEGGACICKTSKLYIIGIYNRTQRYTCDEVVKYQNVGMCNTVVENTANLLKRYNY